MLLNPEGGDIIHTLYFVIKKQTPRYLHNRAFVKPKTSRAISVTALQTKGR